MVEVVESKHHFIWIEFTIFIVLLSVVTFVEMTELIHVVCLHVFVVKVVTKLQDSKTYVQPPPPGCPRDIYQLMVYCW